MTDVAKLFPVSDLSCSPYVGSSIDLSAPTILLPKVRIPSMFIPFTVKFYNYYCQLH